MVKKHSGKLSLGVWLLLGVLYISCCWWMVYGFRLEYREYCLRKHGIDADAVVTAIHPRTRRASGTIDFEFEYSGRNFKGSDFATTAFQSNHPVGAVVRIRFLPTSPDVSHLPAQNIFRRVQWLLGLAIISAFPILLPIGLLQAWITSRSRLRAKSP